MADTDSTPHELTDLVALLTGAQGPETRFAEEIADRRVEFDALVELLMRDATPGGETELTSQVARAIAGGCLGEQHLWRDLHLPSRAALRAVLEAYFAPLAAGNSMDMRWKKYIYRRLCRWEGFSTCKSPSCSECDDYELCFGPE